MAVTKILDLHKASYFDDERKTIGYEARGF